MFLMIIPADARIIRRAHINPFTFITTSNAV